MPRPSQLGQGSAGRSPRPPQAEHVSGSYADPANTVWIDGRTVVGAGVEWARPGPRPTWRLRLSVRDVFDVRPLDVVGFPLPGRRWAVQFVVSEPPR